MLKILIWIAANLRRLGNPQKRILGVSDYPLDAFHGKDVYENDERGVMKMAMLIIAIIAGIGVPIFLYFYSEQKPNILFTLSDQLRIGQAEGEKIWQQIAVRNSGKVEAKNTQIKIESKIVDYQIDKHSEADEPDVFDRSDSFELVYPELPANGTFKLTFATTGSDKINLEDISISHSTGKGIEAFSRVGFKDLLPYLVVGLIASVYVIISSLTLAWSHLDSNVKLYPIEKVLMKNKPFYITERKWLSSRKDALRNVIGYDRPFDDVTLSKSYQILRDEPPGYLSQKEWEELKAEAVSNVIHNFDNKMTLARYHTEELLALLRIEYPKSMPEATWLRIQREINNHYFDRMTNDASKSNIEELQQLLKGEKPEEVHSDVWQDCLSKVEEIYFEKIERELGYSYDPPIFIEQQDLTVLSPEKAYKLKLKSLPDFRVLEHAKSFLENPKPEWLKKEDYAKYKEIANDAVSANKIKEEYTEKLDLVTKKENELSTKIQKVTSQLEIINQVITNPDALERIEEYNNSFAPGNLENLKKIATLNKQLKSATKN